MNKTQQIYKILLRAYGKQGWWPLISCKGINPTKTGSLRGYHPGDYSYPRTNSQKFEICVGAILAQNTSWVQAEKALLNLNRLSALNATAMGKLGINRLKAAIKPAGYFNQKARKIKEFARFYLSLKGKIPTREELLGVWGVGKETADSMLLYAFKVPTFVVDAYTRRIATNLGLIKKEAEYDSIKSLFEENLQLPGLDVYQECHALIVEHAKRYYSKKADYKSCPLFRKFATGHNC